MGLEWEGPLERADRTCSRPEKLQGRSSIWPTCAPNTPARAIVLAMPADAIYRCCILRSSRVSEQMLEPRPRSTAGTAKGRLPARDSSIPQAAARTRAPADCDWRRSGGGSAVLVWLGPGHFRFGWDRAYGNNQSKIGSGRCSTGASGARACGEKTIYCRQFRPTKGCQLSRRGDAPVPCCLLSMLKSWRGTHTAQLIPKRTALGGPIVP